MKEETKGTRMKILVTGGAGYIGSILTPHLLSHGHQVTVLDNFLYGQDSLLNVCHDPDLDIVRGDCRDEAVLRKALADADAVIALAALVGAPRCDSDRVAATSTNLDAIRLLLKLRSREQMVLYPCTNSGYGIGEKDTVCTEDSALRPISLYGQDKVAAEMAVLEAGNSLSFRFATIFGVSPRMRTDLLVNDFVCRAVTDRCVVVFEGHFKRNYLYIRDAAKVFEHALENFTAMRGQPYNVGLEEANLSKLELCAEIQKQIPSFTYVEAAIGEDPDKRDYTVSNERIHGAGFRPAGTLAQGISELKKAYGFLPVRRYSNV